MSNYVGQILALLCLLLTVSCSVKPDDLSENTSIDEIFNLAEKARDRKSFQEAGDFYMEIENLFPYSDGSRKALIEAMKSYHKGSDLLSARLSAKRYLTLYPTGEDAAFSKYIIGLSHFDAIVDVQRDQGAALHAVREFTELIEQFPGSEFTKMARENLAIAYAQLAGQEMVVGRYYMKRKDYLAAINRFSTVKNNYSDTIFEVEALYRLTEAYIALGMEDLAKSTNQKLKTKYTHSLWANKSSTLVSMFTD